MGSFIICRQTWGKNDWHLFRRTLPRASCGSQTNFITMKSKAFELLHIFIDVTNVSKAKVRLRIFFVQVLLQRMLSKQRGPLVHLGLSTSGNVGSIRKNYPVSNIWRQFWFCRRLNLWSVTILARYLSRGNFDFQNHYKWILPQASLSQDHQVVLSCQIYLHMIVTVIFYHHHLSHNEYQFKSRILSWSVRTVRRNYLVVVVL